MPLHDNDRWLTANQSGVQEGYETHQANNDHSSATNMGMHARYTCLDHVTPLRTVRSCFYFVVI